MVYYVTEQPIDDARSRSVPDLANCGGSCRSWPYIIFQMVSNLNARAYPELFFNKKILLTLCISFIVFASFFFDDFLGSSFYG
jgi:hypothetical protein